MPPKDPTEPIRLAASKYPGVAKGTSCTQSSFKTSKAFLYTGPQGGRFKAMFSLGKSLAEAKALAKKDPDRFQVGNTSWVTARFSAEEPMPRTLWKKWLDESYELSLGSGGPKKKTSKKKTAKKKKVTKKKATKKKATKKKR